MLGELKAGKKAEVPIYSFETHSRLDKTHTIYAPHVLILEGIFALHDQRVLDLLDMRVYADADADLCLSRRLVRDVRERGRDIEGCIKQWFKFVKPNFHRYVERQRDVADIIVPRGIENTVAISMVVDRVKKTLKEKSKVHQEALKRLGDNAEDAPLGPNVVILDNTPQLDGLNTIVLDPATEREDFIFCFDRIATMLVEKATESLTFIPHDITTPIGRRYRGLKPDGIVSAVVILRGGSILENGLHLVIPDCQTGRMLMQTSTHTGEPELHYLKLADDLPAHSRVILLDPQMSSGGAALMAVRVLLDHGVLEERIVFVTYFAGRRGLARLMSVFPDITVIVGRTGPDLEERWIEEKYLGC